MGIICEQNIRQKALLEVAERMAIAARTAPKGRGVDNLAISIAEKDMIEKISLKMKELVQNENASDFFIRDANNILSADAMVLIGTGIKPMGLKYCGLCGFKNCDEKNKCPDHPCVFNTGDLGIAIGSAVSTAMDARVDNRIMYTVGMAVRALGLLGEDIKIIYGIPLSASAKNPFFDRR
ncbi:MAG: DUF2148 domain-containing protein [Firmicutes bacterium]|nr:DUF2148 domain-containing protein [Bacillota bacterium]